jgi:hypothetical protein
LERGRANERIYLPIKFCLGRDAYHRGINTPGQREYFIIPPTIKIVSYTSIIYMILVYDTPHYDQP